MEMEFDKFEFFKSLILDGKPYVPHAGQIRLHNSTARIRMVACGSRWGKTTASAAELMAAMVHEPDLYWCVAPTYDLSDIIFKKVLHGWMSTKPDFIHKHSETRRYLSLVNGAELQGKSTDNPVSLLGRGPKGMGIDEPARMKEEIWYEFLQPRLTEKKGWTIFTGTPRGRNWYQHQYMKGKQHNQTEFWSTEGPTWENPIIDKAWLIERKSNYPERFWKQEILGYFIDDTGAVFRNIRGRIQGAFEDPVKGAIYVIGADIARLQDFTVIIVLRIEPDGTARIVFFDRFNQIDWPFQRERIKQASIRYNNAIVFLDWSGIGDPVRGELSADGVDVYAVKTAQEKTTLINSLSVAMDNKKITYPEIPELINEMEIFEYSKTEKTGKIQYHAPEGTGLHDDCVISLALAWRGTKGMGEVRVAKKGL